VIRATVPVARRDGRDAPEQPVLFVLEAGREEQDVGRPGRVAIAEVQRPKPLDLNRPTARPEQGAARLTGDRVVSVDPPVTEMAPQQRAGEPAEVIRRQRQPPGPVELASGDEPAQEGSV